ncbi:hypothetical protein FO440_14705 [Mucilaginibacter corticis]|uniref:Uncharacterized protein n=1 Tax=Mucilaginibacter corticis TaxID=2597670 RepID=A0A556MM33_9SPHI|nr:heparin lyase I family protein [Mucilaginibacter corticis]TSJ40981.1 hypothetical protein FO440_14705 [Mucilaginibacter corticis]
MSKDFTGKNAFFKQSKSMLLLIVSLWLSCKKEAVPVAGKDSSGITTTVSASSYAVTVQNKPVAIFDAALTAKGDLSAYQKTPGDPFTAMVINPACISVVNDPVYSSKRKVMLMNVNVQDNAGITKNPRAQVQTPMSYTDGQTIYVGFSVRFTQTFWTYFLTFSEFYGAPYIGTSPFRLGIQGSNIVAVATDLGKEKNLYQNQMQANVWYDFVYREVLSTDPSKGQVQVWLRKQGQTGFSEILPSTGLATITAANLTGPNYHKLACYYDKDNTYTDASKKTHVSNLKMYLANHKIGSSFDTVAPALIK